MSTKHQETHAEAKTGLEAEPLAEASESPMKAKGESAESGTEPAEAQPTRPEGAEAEPETSEEDSRLSKLEAELAKVREELSSVNDKYLRKLAEDANFRKRMIREKEDGQRFAVSALLCDLIPVLDDFDRAIGSAETQKDYAVLHDGVLLIRRQLGSVLESKYGLSRFESLGKPFDPNHHEAVAMERGAPEDGDEAIVAEEFLPGYGLHDRIVRTAKVRVRMPAPREAASGAQGGAPDEKQDTN
jgi:molecular chaperone GrpE